MINVSSTVTKVVVPIPSPKPVIDHWRDEVIKTFVLTIDIVVPIAIPKV